MYSSKVCYLLLQRDSRVLSFAICRLLLRSCDLISMISSPLADRIFIVRRWFISVNSSNCRYNSITSSTTPLLFSLIIRLVSNARLVVVTGCCRDGEPSCDTAEAETLSQLSSIMLIPDISFGRRFRSFSRRSISLRSSISVVRLFFSRASFAKRYYSWSWLMRWRHSSRCSFSCLSDSM